MKTWHVVAGAVLGVVVVASAVAGVLMFAFGDDGPSEEERATARASESSASASAASASAAEAAASRSASLAAEAQVAYDECLAGTTVLMDALKDMNSRLSVGLTYQDYGEKVGDVQVAYDASVDGILETASSCLGGVGAKLETAVKRYREVQDIWSDCIDDYGCDFSEGPVNDKVQAKWAQATRGIEKAEENLAAIAP
jgi:hypothetical protein